LGPLIWRIAHGKEIALLDLSQRLDGILTRKLFLQWKEIEKVILTEIWKVVLVLGTFDWDVQVDLSLYFDVLKKKKEMNSSPRSLLVRVGI